MTFEKGKDLLDGLETNWKHDVLDLSSWLPFVVLVVDMLFNRIRLPFKQISCVVGISFLYVLICYSFQTNDSMPIFIENLNFKCTDNFSFLAKKTETQT